MTKVGFSANGRTADHDVDPMFLERWSPRAFTGEPMPQALLMSLFEAARWAPSSANSQPWSYIVATKDDAGNFSRVLECFVEGNQS